MSNSSRPQVHYFSRRLASSSKTEVHARVVVVGLSCCALGLLKALLLAPALALAHVTVVSPAGLDAGGRAGPSDEDVPTDFELEALGLGQRLRVVRARVADLDRANRAVVLPDGALVLYDVLVLTHGLQENAAASLTPKRGPQDFLAFMNDVFLPAWRLPSSWSCSGMSATRLRGLSMSWSRHGPSTSRPRRRCDPLSTDYPRRSCGVAATRVPVP